MQACRMPTSLHFAGIVMLFAAACTNTETGNPVSGELLLKPYTSNERKVALGRDGAKLRINTVWVAAKTVRFVDSANCATTRAGHDGAAFQVLNLLAEPLRATYPLEESFCSVDILTEPATGALPAGAPAALQGSSLLIEGVRADGTPVQVVSPTTAPLQYQSDSLLTSGQSQLFAWLDVAHLFADVDLDALAPNVEGRIVLSRAENAALLERIQRRVGDSVEVKTEDQAPPEEMLANELEVRLGVQIISQPTGSFNAYSQTGYTLKVANQGTAQATGVTVTLRLESSIDPVAISPSCTKLPDTTTTSYRCAVGTVAPAAESQLAFRFVPRGLEGRTVQDNYTMALDQDNRHPNPTPALQSYSVYITALGGAL